ncbi:MAG TPA: PAS domain S-box protein [Deltaproteobacteria bacterium]|nr:PAS domain S-box protein [Deltaproteobacteria bacterium]HPR53675.1 PAS domain S-box protein [Deltaproteobacteria bacterium]HXK47191.1 PAS domain S-box protein [Deltaproteobacteria bacterium]
MKNSIAEVHVRPEDKYRQIVENANEFIVIIQGDSIRFINQKARALPCYQGEDLIEKSFLGYIHPDDRAKVMDFHVRRSRGEEVPNIYVFRIFDRTGRVYWVENNAVRIEWEGSPATLNFLTDITEQKRIEEELRASEERNRLYLENASDIIFVMDLEFHVLSISPRVFDVIGYTADELMLQDIARMDILRPEYVSKAYEEISQVVDGRRITSSVYEITAKNGTNLFVEISAAPLILDGRLTNIICIARNITERKAMEDSLRISEKRYREILDEIEDGYYEVDLLGAFTFFNGSMCKILGYEPDELMGMNNRTFMNESTAHRVFSTFNQVFTTGEPAKAIDWELIRKNGATCSVETSITLMRDGNGAPMGFRGIARDITDQKNLEQQLYQSQKMEAIGTLAGGIAHDFNNILSGIIGYTELALLETSEQDPVYAMLHQVIKAGERARDLVNQILTFSRRGRHEKKPVMIRPVVEEAIRMLRATLPANIEIYRAIHADEAIIEADSTLIHQIVLNLCTNAYHAVKDAGGFIEVKLEEVDLGREVLLTSPVLRPGAHVRLSVTDTGCGMSPDVVDRIFDPYFTTKTQGEGTGLGLAIVQGIVRSLGGLIRVQSTPGKGSSFQVYLPKAADAAQHEARPMESLPSGCENVLVIDDEKNIIDITRLMLERLGYRVTTHQSSIEALDHFRKSYDDYDLIISDLTMPRMNGDKLAENMLKIRPDIPIILCTGFTDLISHDKATVGGIRDVLTKPVMLGDLAATIRRVLDSRDAENP